MTRWVWLAAATELRHEGSVAGATLVTAQRLNLAYGATPVTEAQVLAYVQAQASDEDALCGLDFAKANAARVAATLADFPHARVAPPELLLEYVAPTAVLDEPRRAGGECVQWWQRDDFVPLLKRQPEVRSMQLGVPSRHVAEYVAGKLQDLLGLHFHGDDTPKYMSPHEILGASNPKHEASCTGMSILYVDALRALGVPARIAGTPAWNGNGGNHDWVEAYVCNDMVGTDCEWAFFDALAPLRAPCENWFCSNEKLGSMSGTRVFVSRFAKTETDFPLAWAPEKHRGGAGVYGEDRTEQYVQLCAACPPPAPSLLQLQRVHGAEDLVAAKDRVEKAVAHLEQEIAAAAVAAEARGRGHA